MTPCRGNTFPSVPPSNSLVSVSDPCRAFWADMAPFKGPWLASYVASGTTENQGHSQFCCAGRGGPRKPSKTTDANLDYAFVLNALYFTDPLEFTKKAWKSKNVDVIKILMWLFLDLQAFLGCLTSFADFQHISCQTLNEKFSCQISCQIPSVNFDTRFLTWNLTRDLTWKLFT